MAVALEGEGTASRLCRRSSLLPGKDDGGAASPACPLYTHQRQAVSEAMRDHITAISNEHGYPLTQEEALEWVIGDESPGGVAGALIDRGASAVLSVNALRGAVLDMHREVRKARYSASKAVPAERRVSNL